MKKFKKVLSLVLVLAMVVGFMPMMEKVAKASDSNPKDGYYRWYLSKKKVSTWEEIGTSVISGIDNPVVAGTGQQYASDYKDSEGNKLTSVKVTSNGDTYTYERACKISSGIAVVFTAPYDGNMQIYYKPGGKVTVSPVYLTINGEKVGDEITLKGENTSFSYLAADDMWCYEMVVSKGVEYSIGANTDVGLSQISYTPNAVSTLGASYRKPTEEHGNGIRFGSTIDKTSIDYAKVTESGTLIALESKMEAARVEELTMDEVGKVCIQVKRTTYLVDDESKLNYTAAIVNIPDDAVDNVIVARPYVVIDGVTYYGAQMENSWTGVQAALKN